MPTPVACAAPKWFAECGYYGKGMRTSITQTVGTGGPQTYYEQSAMVLGLPQIVFRDGRTHIWSDTYVGEHDGINTTSISIPLMDAQGSVRFLTDSAGNVTTAQSYDAFGVTAVISGSGTTFGYTGQRHDPTGLVYPRARFYDPATGRFLKPDPVYQGLQYAYVSNNPLGNFDPTGLRWEALTDLSGGGGSAADSTLALMALALLQASVQGIQVALVKAHGRWSPQDYLNHLNDLLGHLSPKDIDAAKREADGQVVALRPDGKPYDHRNEIAETLAGLEDSIDALESKIAHLEQYGGEQAAVAIGEYRERLKQYKRVQQDVHDQLRAE